MQAVTETEVAQVAVEVRAAICSVLAAAGVV